MASLRVYSRDSQWRDYDNVTFDDIGGALMVRRDGAVVAYFAPGGWLFWEVVDDD